MEPPPTRSAAPFAVTRTQSCDEPNSTPKPPVRARDGLGDDAFFYSNHLFVLTGTIQIDVYASTVKGPANDTRVAKALAGMVLARLKLGSAHQQARRDCWPARPDGDQRLEGDALGPGSALASGRNRGGCCRKLASLLYRVGNGRRPARQRGCRTSRRSRQSFETRPRRRSGPHPRLARRRHPSRHCPRRKPGTFGRRPLRSHRRDRSGRLALTGCRRVAALVLESTCPKATVNRNSQAVPFRSQISI
jgi:hypothetical protein